MRMGPMWRKARRWSVRFLVGLAAVLLGSSLAFNALTRPKGLAPREAGVPGAFVDVEGSLTHYETAGAGKVPVVLLHGFGSWSYTWRPALAALGDDGRFTAYAPDMRGFGFTDRPPDALYNLDGFTRHVEAFIDALELDRPILVGSSLGGEVAIRVALDRPDRVRGLVLVAAAAYDSPSPLAQAAARVLFVPPFNRSFVRIFSRWFIGSVVDRAYYDTSTIDRESLVQNLRKPFQQRGAEDAWVAMVRQRVASVPAERVRTLRLPTLIVWGAEDEVIPVERGARLNSDIANSRLFVYPRTGHLPQEEARERFAADLLSFCGELAPPA